MESDAVRCRFESLAQSDSVDKPTALEVMALHHDMQTQYLRHCHSMERRIDALKNNLLGSNIDFGDHVRCLAGHAL